MKKKKKNLNHSIMKNSRFTSWNSWRKLFECKMSKSNKDNWVRWKDRTYLPTEEKKKQLHQIVMHQSIWAWWRRRTKKSLINEKNERSRDFRLTKQIFLRLRSDVSFFFSLSVSFPSLVLSSVLLSGEKKSSWDNCWWSEWAKFAFDVHWC